MICSLESSGLKPGNWACFPGGAGGVGIQGVQLAKAMGFRPIVVDTGDDKREFALKMGAEAFVDFRTCGDVAGEVKRVAGGVGAHGVFVTGTAAYGSAVGYVGDRVNGVVCCIGVSVFLLLLLLAFFLFFLRFGRGEWANWVFVAST